MDTTTTNTGAGALIVLALSALVSSGLLGAVFVYFRRLVEARIGAIHTAQAIEVTGEAVRAAEEIGRTHGLDGAQKYREATVRASDILTQHGIALSADQLRTLIQGAVTELKQAAAPPVVVASDTPSGTVTPAPAPASVVAPTAEEIAAALAPLFAPKPVPIT